MPDFNDGFKKLREDNEARAALPWYRRFSLKKWLKETIESIQSDLAQLKTTSKIDKEHSVAWHEAYGTPVIRQHLTDVNDNLGGDPNRANPIMNRALAAEILRRETIAAIEKRENLSFSERNPNLVTRTFKGLFIGAALYGVVTLGVVTITSVSKHFNETAQNATELPPAEAINELFQSLSPIDINKIHLSTPDEIPKDSAPTLTNP